jgi:hypothetical protein
MPKVLSKAQRKAKRLAAARKTNYVCRACPKHFRTQHQAQQHKRVCRRYKEYTQERARKAQQQRNKKKLLRSPFKKQLQLLGYEEGGMVFIAGKTRKPKRGYGAVWVKFVTLIHNCIIPVWGTVHPDTGNMVVCLQSWPQKTEIELPFGFFGGRGREFFNSNGKVLDRWAAAIELV